MFTCLNRVRQSMLWFLLSPSWLPPPTLPSAAIIAGALKIPASEIGKETGPFAPAAVAAC